MSSGVQCHVCWGRCLWVEVSTGDTVWVGGAGLRLRGGGRLKGSVKSCCSSLHWLLESAFRSCAGGHKTVGIWAQTEAA